MATKRPNKSRKRRDKENELIVELSSLLPLDIPKDTKLDKLSVMRMTLAYLKCRNSLETDHSDVLECLATKCNDDCPPCRKSSASVPVAMLDNDGNLVAGTLANPDLILKDSDISLSDSVVARLERTFLNGHADSTMIDVDQGYENLQRYKEGLERGMREFLSQTPVNVAHGSPPRIGSSPDQTFTNVSLALSVRNPKSVNCSSIYQNVCSWQVDIIESANELRNNFDAVNEGSLMLEAVPGFFLMLDRYKKVLFASVTVADVLGIVQTAIIGHDIATIIYDKDLPELDKQMCDEQFLEDKEKGVPENALLRTFYMAMSFQKSRTRQKYSGYKLIRWDAKLRLYRDKSTHDIRVKSLFALCRPVRDYFLVEYHSYENVFLTKHGLDYKCIYCDPRIQDITGYNPNSILGTDGFSLKHPCDVMLCHYKHKSLPVDGKGDSGYYRLLGRNGKWMWAYSQYTVIYNATGQPIHVEALTYIVSMEEAKCVLSREKEDYQRMKDQGFDFDLTYYGLSETTLAKIVARKKLKSSHKITGSGVGGDVNVEGIVPIGRTRKSCPTAQLSTSVSNDMTLAADSTARHVSGTTRQCDSTCHDKALVHSAPENIQSSANFSISTTTPLSELFTDTSGQLEQTSPSPLLTSACVQSIVDENSTDLSSNHSPKVRSNHCGLVDTSDHLCDTTEWCEVSLNDCTRCANSSLSNKAQNSSVTEESGSSTEDFDLSLSPLPSVDFNSPSIDIDLLMSDQLDFEAGLSNLSSDNIQITSSSEEEFEVQSILNYFVQDKHNSSYEATHENQNKANYNTCGQSESLGVSNRITILQPSPNTVANSDTKTDQLFISRTNFTYNSGTAIEPAVSLDLNCNDVTHRMPEVANTPILPFSHNIDELQSYLDSVCQNTNKVDEINKSLCPLSSELVLSNDVPSSAMIGTSLEKEASLRGTLNLSQETEVHNVEKVAEDNIIREIMDWMGHSSSDHIRHLTNMAKCNSSLPLEHESTAISSTMLSTSYDATSIMADLIIEEEIVKQNTNASFVDHPCLNNHVPYYEQPENENNGNKADSFQESYQTFEKEGFKLSPSNVRDDLIDFLLCD